MLTQDAVFMVKSDRAIPYMSVGKRSDSWWNRARAKIVNVAIEETHGRRIDVVNWPSKIDEKGFMQYNGVHIKSKRGFVVPEQPVRPDVVIFATGYRPSFPFLTKGYPSLLDANVRRTYKDSDVTVGYIGFCRPSIGAIPPVAELQAQLWVLRLLQHVYPKDMPPLQHQEPDAVAQYELDYQLHPRGSYDFYSSKGGVDHESFAYQLAVDMGSAPTITYVMKQGWKVFFTWAMGSNFNTKFRMVGPWKAEAAALETMRGELYNVVKRSGGGVCKYNFLSVFLVESTASNMLTT